MLLLLFHVGDVRGVDVGAKPAGDDDADAPPPGDSVSGLTPCDDVTLLWNVDGAMLLLLPMSQFSIKSFPGPGSKSKMSDKLISLLLVVFELSTPPPAPAPLNELLILSHSSCVIKPCAPALEVASAGKPEAPPLPKPMPGELAFLKLVVTPNCFNRSLTKNTQTSDYTMTPIRDAW